MITGVCVCACEWVCPTLHIEATQSAQGCCSFIYKTKQSQNGYIFVSLMACLVHQIWILVFKTQEHGQTHTLKGRQKRDVCKHNAQSSTETVKLLSNY